MPGNDKRRRDLAAIHAETKRQGLDEATYRAMVERISRGRTDSSAALDASERGHLLRELGGRARRPLPGRGPSAAAMDRTAMLGKVEALLGSMSLSWAYAEAILRQQRGIADKSVGCPLDAASEPELRGVIAALYRRGNPKAPRRGAS